MSERSTSLTNRSGMRIHRATWDSNGAFHVVIRDPYPIRTRNRERAARRLARRVDQMGLSRWTRLDRVTYDDAMFYHITVSRLDRSYR